CPADAFQPATVECRPSTAACDPAELCTGTGAACPADVVGSMQAVGNTVRLSHDRPSSTTTISWTGETEPGPFNVYRGSHISATPWAYNQACFQQNVPVPTVTDTQTPGAGQVYFYLISRTDAHCAESPLGQNSAGNNRPNGYPCPSPGPD